MLDTELVGALEEREIMERERGRVLGGVEGGDFGALDGGGEGERRMRGKVGR